jgi:hypothetical protein
MKPVNLAEPTTEGSGLRPFGLALIARLESLERRLAEQSGRPGSAAAVLMAERALLDRLRVATDSREGERILHRAVDEEYFRTPIAAGIAKYSGAGTLTEVLNNNAWVMRYPAAGSNHADVQVPIKALWPLTRPRIEILYTSPVGSTNTFNFRFTFWVFGPGVTTATAAVATSLDWSAPGPAVANDILKTSAVVTNARFPSSPAERVRFRLSRLPSPDANANDLDVLGVLIILEEVA